MSALFPLNDTFVLDSEWHWIFDCILFRELRDKNPYFFDFLKSLKGDRGYADIDDLGNLLTAIQNDSRLGFSLVSFLRQAITLREKWMEGACVRGRLCDVPGHWGRNLIRDPPCAAELSEFFEDFEQSFLDGQPFEFAEIAYEMFASSLLDSRSELFRIVTSLFPLPSCMIISTNFSFSMECLFCVFLATIWSISLFIFKFFGPALLSSTEDAGAVACVFALPVGHILGCLLVVFSRT